MYAVFRWMPSSYWEQVKETLCTMEEEAVNKAIEITLHPQCIGIYAVIEDGRDQPCAIIYGGVAFYRNPEKD